MKKKRRAYKQNPLSTTLSVGDNLEWFEENYKETCENCQSPLTVHSYRRGSPKYHQAVYAHCTKKNCRNYQVVICFYL